MELSKIGLLRANKEACSTNVLKLSDSCGCSSASPSKDTINKVVASARSVTSVTFEGEEFLVADHVANTTAIPVTDTDALQSFLNKVLETSEFDTWSTVAYDGTNLVIEHIGQGELESIKLDDGTICPFESCSTIANLFKYQTFAEGDIPEIGYNGAVATLANNPYSYTGTAATDEGTAATLQTDFEAALTTLGVPFSSVLVEVNTAAGGFDLQAMTTEESVLTIGTVGFQYCGVTEDFFCA